MILVTLGTQNKPFSRLLEKVVEQIDSGAIDERVIAQIGHTEFACDCMDTVDFMPYAELAASMDECTILVSHGGAGTLWPAIKLGKRIIAVPRLKEFGEHVNDHQVEIVEYFADEGYLIASNGDDFGECLERVRTFQPATYCDQPNTVAETIAAYIDGLPEAD